MAARMKDIAQELGLSIVTVSKVLNKTDERISEPTRKRVLEVARRLNYRPNLAAKSLVTGQSKMVGLIVPELFHGFFGAIAAGMSDTLRQHGYGLIISSSRDQESLEQEEITQLLARSVDALVIASCSSNTKSLKAAAEEVPLVLLDRRVGDVQSFWLVGADDVRAGELATEHLLALGRKRILFIGAADFSPTAGRREGYLKAMRAAGIDPPEEWMHRLSQSEESHPTQGGKIMRQLLKARTRPDAVFCYNDPTAWGVTVAILEAGLRVPEDIAVIGCGNNPHDDLLRVPLTSVNLDAARMGEEAARLAVRLVQERLNNVVSEPGAVLLDPELVIRQSTAAGQASTV